MKRTFKNTMFVVLTLMALIVSALGVTSAKAAPVQLAFYNPLGGQNPLASDLAASAVDPSVTASVLSNFTGGYDSGTNTDRRPVMASAGALNTATSFYLSFTLTPVAPGMAIQLSSITYTYESYVSGSSGTVSLMTSADGFTSVVDSKTFAGVSSGAWTFNASSVPATAGPLEIRLYAHDLIGGTPHWQFAGNVDWVDLLSTATSGFYAPNVPGDGLRVYGEVVPACSASITVTSNADSGAGTLRQAIADVCAGGTINFDSSLSGGTITLGSTLPTITTAITIDGSSLALPITIDGANSYRQFVVTGASAVLGLKNLIVANGSSCNGGAILSTSNATVNITDSTFTGNMDSGCAASVMFSNGFTTITNSTFYNNSAPNGSVLRNGAGNLTIKNSTITGNTTSGNAALFTDLGTNLYVYNSTIAENGSNSSGAATDGIFVYFGNLYLYNTIVYGKGAGSDCSFVGGSYTNVNNLASDSSCSASVIGDPLLGSLANNGGKTMTRAIGSSSPALDAGNNAFCQSTDQRGVSRPVDGNGDTTATCDIGAYEYNIPSDTTPPVVTVPADMTVEATSASGAVVTFSASATDETSPANPAVTCVPASGSTFPLGATPVTCSATDDASNTGYGYFNVTVQDTTAPSLTLPADITTEATSASGAAVSFSVTASDLVDASPTINCAPASGSTFPIGATTVNCSATDDYSNTSNGSFSVTVQDTTAPSLTLPADITVPQTIPAGAIVSYSASASDLVDGSVAVTCAPPSGSIFPVGVTTVNCSATDAHSNTGSGSFTVTVTSSGANLLKKPDFPSASIFPYPWQGYNIRPPYTGVLDCALFNNGPCSVVFGPGNRAAIQKVIRSGLAGDLYSFGMYSAAQNVPAGGNYSVEVFFYNNYNRLVGHNLVSFNPGSHPFELGNATASPTANYNRIVFRFNFNNPSGRAWFDDAFLFFLGAP